MSINNETETRGIGPFRFRTNRNLNINSFLNEIKDNKYTLDFDSDQQNFLNAISDSLLEYNLIEKYAIKQSEASINTKSLFEYEKKNFDKFQAFNFQNENTKKELPINSHLKSSAQIKNTNEIININNDSTKTNNLNEIKDSTTSKYFGTSKDSSNNNDSKYQLLKILNKKSTSNINKDKEKKEIEIDSKEKSRKDLSSILRGVNIVISGIENPERGKIRTLALEMGAKYHPKWIDSSTHLICAVKGTPKYNEVKEKGKGIIVKSGWIYDCYKKKDRLLEKYYSFDYNRTKSISDGEESDTSVNATTSNSIYSIFNRKANNKKNDDDKDDDDNTIRSNNSSKNAIQNISNNNNNNNKDDDGSNKLIRNTLKKSNSFSYKSNISEDNKRKNKKIYEFFKIINSDKENNDKENDDKTKNLKLIRNILSISNIFKNQYFYFDDTIKDKTKKELERYVLGHGGNISINNDDKITYYCTIKNSSEVDFKGTIIDPTYIINCHNKNCLL
ncbi:hypothetical protein BCR32DRAFT_292535 [Anaeromyces robustus]|uniref:BRCT domain-containing protein n=1 Tax=Anaeromyces robustus TaxID=1754192 RepID=A0A1Y1XA23_9FUNG|nr:hypothetical protein BCR32DRAFT_292535 [Anaeromyces robustus]|eukprot:ORX82595.1 hypothetical protein BCR32DRAFT_292535 [Anaeromyces robustus]